MFVRCVSMAILAVGLSLTAPAGATTFTFATDPFAGSDALQTPGRQIIGGEANIPVFDFDNDVLAFDTSVFGLTNGLSVFNGEIDLLPAGGTNFNVLRTFDSDGNPANANQLAAGSAAALIAQRVTTPNPGFFIYFNSGLDLPRLVYSTDLDSADADLKILARFNGLTGDAGRAAMTRFTAANVAAVPEPASWAMMIAGFALVGSGLRRRSRGAITAGALG